MHGSAGARTRRDVFRRHGDAYLRRPRRTSRPRRTARHGRDRGLPHSGARRSRRAVRRLRHCRASPTTPAAIAIARSVRGRRGRIGLPRAKPNCCRFPISTSSSPCRAPIAEIAFQNKAVVYAILFAAAAEAMTTLAADPRISAPRSACVAVLHTWGQTLTHHPHVHCVVPGGGSRSTGSAGSPASPDFFLPVKRALRDCSAACSSNGLQSRLRRQGDLASSAISRRSPNPRFRRASARALRRARLGRLRQAAVWRTRASSRLSRALHPSRRDRQLQPRPRSTDDHVAFAWKDYRDGGAARPWLEARRVHSPLPAACLARRLSSHSPLRLPRQWPSNAKARTSVARS